MAENSIIRPPRHISRKVPKTGGLEPEEAILRALSAASELTEEYQGWAVDDLERLWGKFKKLSGDAENSKADISELFDIAHEIRGQGGSFDFPLITTIADSLCKFIDQRQQLNAAELEVFKVHIMAMKAVFRQQLKGKQPDLNVQLTELLLSIRNKVQLNSSQIR